MKTYLCKTKSLSAAVSRLAGIVPGKRCPKPILRSVLLSINGVATIGGNSIDQSGLEWIDGEPAETVQDQSAAVALVDFARFRAAVKTIKTPRCELSTDGRRVFVGGLELPTEFNPAEFPAVEFAANWPIGFRWFGSAAELAELLESVDFAIDRDSSRYALNGVRVEFDQPVAAGSELFAAVRTIATDGRRLAVARCRVDHYHAAAAGFVIPAEAVKAFKNAAAAAGGGVVALDILTKPAAEAATPPATEPAAEYGRRAAVAQFARLTVADSTGNVRRVLYCRLVEGRFPRWVDVIPAAVDRVRFNAAEAAEAVRSIVPLSNEENRGFRFAVRQNRGFAFYHANGSRGRFSFAAVGNSIGTVRSWFDCRYLLQWLEAAEGSIVFCQKNAEAAALFETENGRFSYVLMPIASGRISAENRIKNRRRLEAVQANASAEAAE